MLCRQGLLHEPIEYSYDATTRNKRNSMSRKKQKTFPSMASWKLATLVALIAACVFALLYGAQFIPPYHPVFKSAVQSFAALLLTSGILSVISSILVRRELANFWLNAIGVRDSVSTSGLYDVEMDFQSYDFHTLVRDAKRIDLCFIHAEKFIGNRLNDFKEFLSHKDHELRVCLLREDCSCAQSLSEDFNYKEGELAQKINNSIAALQSCIADLEKANQSTGWVRIWKHRRGPKYTYYRFDDLLFLIPYNLAAGHTKIPVFGFIRKEGGVSDFLVTDFDRMMNDHSEKVYDSREAKPVASKTN